MKMSRATPEWFAGKVLSSFSSLSDVTDDDNNDNKKSKKNASLSATPNTSSSGTGKNNKSPKKKRFSRNVTNSNKTPTTNKKYHQQEGKCSQEKESASSASNHHHHNSYHNQHLNSTPMTPSHGEMHGLISPQKQTSHSILSHDQDVEHKNNYYGSFYSDKIAMDKKNNKKDDCKRRIDHEHHSLQNYSSILLGYSPQNSTQMERVLGETNHNNTNARPQDYPLGQITDNINAEKTLNSSATKKHPGKNVRSKKKKKKRDEPNKKKSNTTDNTTITHDNTPDHNHQSTNHNNSMIRSTNTMKKNTTSKDSLDYIGKKCDNNTNNSKNHTSHDSKIQTPKHSSATTIPDEIITNTSELAPLDSEKKVPPNKESNNNPNQLSPLSPLSSPPIQRNKNLLRKSPPKSNHSGSYHSSHNSSSNYSFSRLFQYNHHFSPKHSSQHHRITQKEMMRLRKKIEAAQATEYKIRKIVFGNDDVTVTETVYLNSYDDDDDFDSQNHKDTSGALNDAEKGANDNKKNDTDINIHAKSINQSNRNFSILEINDLLFAILFYVQLLIIVYIAIRYGTAPTTKLSNYDNYNGNYNWYQNQHNIIVKDHANFTFNDRYINSNIDHPYYSFPLSDSSSSSSSTYSQTVPLQNPFAVPDNSYHMGNQNEQNNVLREKIYVNYDNAIEVACITGLYAASLSILMVVIIMILSKTLIQSLLLLIILLCFGWVIFGMALCPYSFVPVLGIVFLAICSAYTVVVWDRIPFAATNLDIALNGIRCTADILMTGLGAILVTLLWNILWSYAFIGVFDHIIFCENHRLLQKEWELLVYTGLIISYLWTFNVILNVVNVTVAGTLGRWWFRPQDVNPYCSSALLQPLARSLTSSFGSICFGSLVVPPSQVLSSIISTCCLSCRRKLAMEEDDDISSSLRLMKQDRVRGNVVELTTPSVENGSLQSNLLHKLTFGYIDDNFLKSFNEFAFTFLGIYYQLSFLKSGRKVAKVFEARDWSRTVSDRLIQNALFMASVMIGLMNGLFGILVEEYDGYSLTNFEEPTRAAFLIASWTGFTLSIAFFNIVSSSVNAILVCFAIGPYEFKQNHPRLSDDMRQTWGGFWPDDII